MASIETNNQSGGVNVGGEANVTASGDIVGRDKIVHGDEVQGDKVAGDKITVGNISNATGVAIGRGAQAVVRGEPGGNDQNKA